jgi:hypothetical protein
MPGPYTSFTYGDPAAVNAYPNNPYISKPRRTLTFGLPLGPSYNRSPVGVQLRVV